MTEYRDIPQMIVVYENTDDEYILPCPAWAILPRKGEEFLFTDDETHETLFEGVVSKVRWSSGPDGSYSVFVHVSQPRNPFPPETE